MYVSNLGNQGLMTFPNPLTIQQPGALVQADNTVIVADGILQSRRGVTFIGSSIGIATNYYLDKIFEYQNNFIGHVGNETMFYTSATPFTTPVWTQYPGTYTPPPGSVRPRGAEANKNFYITTNLGIYKQASISSTPIQAGVPPALDGSAALVSGSWFLSPASTAYRITWQYTDLNGNVIEGAPSYRILISNSSGSSKAVQLTFSIPAGITTQYVYNVYRALQTASATVPATDEMQLAYQANPTSAQITAGAVTITDITPEALLGQTFYGSPSQQGATQYNYPPPEATDITTFLGMTFFANTTSLQSVYITMVTTPSIGDTIVINGGAGGTFTAGTSQNPVANLFLVVTSGTPAYNIDATAKNLVACINQSTSSFLFYAYYPVGYNDLPGLIYLQARVFPTPAFYLTSSNGAVYQPQLPASGSSYISSNDVLPNALYVSKLNQPEAVPPSNQLFIGGGDQPIQRILPLRDSLMVFKTDGIFRITGSSPDALTVTPFDNTVFLTCPDSAVLLNNSVFCMTSQMVVAVSDSGVAIESRAIEGDLLELSTTTNFQTATYAISYESERQYLLCTTATNSDESSTQIYVYNWLLNAWTRWTLATSAGIVSQTPDNKLYLGVSYNPEFIYQEIKTYNPNGFDFGDDRFAVTITGTSGLVVTLNSVANAVVGQSLLQGTFDSVVTAVDNVHSTVTVTDLYSWSDAAATLVRPISQVVVTTPIHAGFPHYMKNWTTADFDFSEANFDAIDATFISNVSLYSETVQIAPQEGAAWGDFAWGMEPWGGTSLLTQSIPTLLPLNKSLANWVQVGVSLSQALTNFEFLGVTLSYDIVSDKLR